MQSRCEINYVLILKKTFVSYFDASSFGAALGGRTFGFATSFIVGSGRFFFSTLNRIKHNRKNIEKKNAFEIHLRKHYAMVGKVLRWKCHGSLFKSIALS